MFKKYKMPKCGAITLAGKKCMMEVSGVGERCRHHFKGKTTTKAGDEGFKVLKCKYFLIATGKYVGLDFAGTLARYRDPDDVHVLTDARKLDAVRQNLHKYELSRSEGAIFEGSFDTIGDTITAMREYLVARGIVTKMSPYPTSIEYHFALGGILVYHFDV